MRKVILKCEAIATALRDQPFQPFCFKNCSHQSIFGARNQKQLVACFVFLRPALSHHREPRTGGPRPPFVHINPKFPTQSNPRKFSCRPVTFNIATTLALNEVAVRTKRPAENQMTGENISIAQKSQIFNVLCDCRQKKTLLLQHHCNRKGVQVYTLA